MSLINDALKRTQQTTQSSEPAEEDEFSLPPIEPYQPSNGGARWILWIMIPFFVLAINFAIWIVVKNRGKETLVAARTTEAASVKSASSPSEAATAAPESKNKPSTSSARTGDRHLAAVQTRAGAATPALQPLGGARPEFTLRSIVSHPVRPSAMINNRILFIGDRIEGYTLEEISKTSVTLKSNRDEVVIGLP